MVLNSNVTSYGVQNPRSPNTLTKRNLNKSYGFKYPLGNGTDGKFLKKSSDLDLIKGQLKQLLLTNRGERVMLPNFGTNLRQYLMEPLDQATLSQIKREIMESMRRYAPNVAVSKLQVIPGDTKTPDGGHFIYIRLFCVLLDAENTTFDLKLELK